MAEAKVNENVKERNSRRTYSVNSVNKDEQIFIRVTKSEKEELQAVAAKKNCSLSKLVMDLLSVAYL